MFPCRAGMMLEIFFSYPGKRDVQIDFGGVDFRVSQDRLHGTEIRSTFHHVSRAAMAQHVRPDIAPDCFRAGLHDLPEALPGDLFSLATDENQRRILSK